MTTLQVEEAVKELKRLKNEVERLSKLCNPQGDNVFEEQREDLEDLCKRRFFFRQSFEIYGDPEP